MTDKQRQAPQPKTGWPPGMLQDDCKGLSRWLASKQCDCYFCTTTLNANSSREAQ